MNRFRVRIHWVLGALIPWVAVWLVFGLRYAILIGNNPHPFLPGMSYTGVMLKAVAMWVVSALLAYLAMGLFCALILILSNLIVPGERPPILGFQPGLKVGLAGVLLFHGLLFGQVPVTLGTIQGVRWLPMGSVILTLLIVGSWVHYRSLSLGKARIVGLRLALGLVMMVGFLNLPHDLFRRFMPRGPVIPPDRPRLLIVGIDGLRQDVAEKAMPDWKAPGGCQPIVAIPATRLTWHMLLGAPPESYQNSAVIPFRSEWTNPPKTRLLDVAQQKGLSTGFLIDDPTTLSFGLSRDAFTEVVEPYGGWKHFFSAGLGTCWPAYSWLENFLSPIETTNPWSDPEAYFRDLDRGLEHHQWLSTHTCQLHPPFFLRTREIQKLRPWAWLGHPGRSYIPYQSWDEAARDRFRRRDGRANPINHYRIRTEDLLSILQSHISTWEAKYPRLSGVFTSDHGKEHVPAFDVAGNHINYFAGIHGFTLNPDTIRVPLHGFGQTTSKLGAKDVFSWIDLSQSIEAWLANPEKPLELRPYNENGWVSQFNTVHAMHVEMATASANRKDDSQGMPVKRMMAMTYLTPMGIWFMDDPAPDAPPLVTRKSWANIDAGGITTVNPQKDGVYEIIRYDQAYNMLERRMVKDQEAFALVRAFPGKRLVPLWFPQDVAGKP